MAKRKTTTTSIVVGDGAGLSHIRVTRVASVEDTAKAVGEAAVQSIYRTGAAILAMETRVHGVLVETEAKLREALV